MSCSFFLYKRGSLKARMHDLRLSVLILMLGSDSSTLLGVWVLGLAVPISMSPTANL